MFMAILYFKVGGKKPVNPSTVSGFTTKSLALSPLVPKKDVIFKKHITNAYSLQKDSVMSLNSCAVKPLANSLKNTVSRYLEAIF